mgnify:CR=1 FL=1
MTVRKPVQAAKSQSAKGNGKAESHTHSAKKQRKELPARETNASGIADAELRINRIQNQASEKVV